MSNEKHCERQCRRKSKGSCVKLIFAGLAAPKARPKGVVDGNHVNIRGPVDGDGLRKLYEITGFLVRPGGSRK